MNIKQTFLQNTDNFINDLFNIFPQNKEIALLKEKYYFAKDIDNKIIISYFVQYIYPHKQRIISQDETFFLEGGGQEELKESNGLKFRDNIKNLWLNEMSEENKSIIWKYFKIFVVLCEKYIIENINK
jgi:hypothetical protein